MIKVVPAPEPDRFDQLVRQQGLIAIAELVGEPSKRKAGRRCTKVAERREDIPASKFPNYWTETLDELLQAYQFVCAYSCFRIHPVTGATSVDHFAPKSHDWSQVYEWLNYRLACAKLNSRKRDYGDVLDPFEIEDGWFELELVGFQVVPGSKLPKGVRSKVEATIGRLGLNQFCRDRLAYAQDYWDGHVTFEILLREAPFVARELHRQGRLKVST